MLSCFWPYIHILVHAHLLKLHYVPPFLWQSYLYIRPNFFFPRSKAFTVAKNTLFTEHLTYFCSNYNLFLYTLTQAPILYLDIVNITKNVRTFFYNRNFINVWFTVRHWQLPATKKMPLKKLNRRKKHETWIDSSGKW